MWLIEYLLGSSVRYEHVQAVDADAAVDEFRWGSPEECEVISVRREYP